MASPSCRDQDAQKSAFKPDQFLGSGPQRPQSFTGKLVFLFQPAEETAGGADDILKDGLLAALGVQKIFALHSAPGMAVGTIAISPGHALAGSSSFTVTLEGRASHAAAPYEGDDIPVVAARLAEILTALPARPLDIANRPAVISITKLKATSGASNVIPGKAVLGGSIRAFEDIRRPSGGDKALADILEQTLSGFASALGVKARLEIKDGAPPTLNDPVLLASMEAELRKGWPALEATRWRGMFSEDFAFYTQAIPALYFSLGVAKDGLGFTGVHEANFTVHPDALEAGVRFQLLLARVALGGTR